MNKKQTIIKNFQQKQILIKNCEKTIFFLGPIYVLEVTHRLTGNLQPLVFMSYEKKQP